MLQCRKIHVKCCFVQVIIIHVNMAYILHKEVARFFLAEKLYERNYFYWKWKRWMKQQNSKQCGGTKRVHVFTPVNVHLDELDLKYGHSTADLSHTMVFYMCLAVRNWNYVHVSIFLMRSYLKVLHICTGNKTKQII